MKRLLVYANTQRKRDDEKRVGGDSGFFYGDVVEVLPEGVELGKHDLDRCVLVEVPDETDISPLLVSKTRSIIGPKDAEEVFVRQRVKGIDLDAHLARQEFTVMDEIEPVAKR